MTPEFSLLFCIQNTSYGVQAKAGRLKKKRKIQDDRLEKWKALIWTALLSDVMTYLSCARHQQLQQPCLWEEDPGGRDRRSYTCCVLRLQWCNLTPILKTQRMQQFPERCWNTLSLCLRRCNINCWLCTNKTSGTILSLIFDSLPKSSAYKSRQLWIVILLPLCQHSLAFQHVGFFVIGIPSNPHLTYLHSSSLIITAMSGICHCLLQLWKVNVWHRWSPLNKLGCHNDNPLW